MAGKHLSNLKDRTHNHYVSQPLKLNGIEIQIVLNVVFFLFSIYICIRRIFTFSFLTLMLWLNYGILPFTICCNVNFMTQLKFHSSKTNFQRWLFLKSQLLLDALSLLLSVWTSLYLSLLSCIMDKFRDTILVSFLVLISEQYSVFFLDIQGNK